ncbi:MAG: AbrB/MazE/SpoVT family DNA-binding domain-containing protein, partial [Gaiellaceae bacterium]
MKSTGIIRHIDELGRIVIPIEIRKRFGLAEKDPLEIFVKDETILLSRPKSACVFCGRTDSV